MNSSADRARRFVFVCLSFALFLSAPRAFAQRILVLRPPNSDAVLVEAFERLNAELLLEHFEVIVYDGPDAVDADVLEAEAQEAGAFAAIALTRRPNGAIADVCIVDRITGKTTQRRLAFDQASDAPTLLAVRAVDLLRASLRELEPGKKAPPDVLGVDPAPTPPEVETFSAPPRDFSLRLGAFGAGLGSELGPAFGPELNVGYRPHRAVTISLGAVGPLFGATFTADAGTASIRQELALASVFWNFLPKRFDTTISLGPTLSLGVHHLEARGVVEPPLASQTGELWSFALTGGAAAEVPLGGAFYLYGSAGCLVLLPQPVVALENETTSALSPVLVTSLGVGIAL